MQLSIVSKNIQALESTLLGDLPSVLTKVEPLTRHYFSKGLYCREMAIPAGTIMTGKEHLQDHICIITKGKCKVVSEEYTGVIEAPFIYASKKGAKRAIYAFTDLVWVTTHATSETDIDKIEQMLVR